MTIITSRTKQNGTVRINQEQCTACGLCVKVCKDFSLVQTNGRIEINPTPVFGCYGCGQCMAICPTGAITVSGREISPEDLQALPPDSERASFGQLTNLYWGRRSIRDFKDQEIDDETLQKILDAAALSPMGLPPSDVHVAVFRNRETVREFSFDVMNLYQKSRWLFSLPWVWIWRIFGKETYEMMTGFVRPLVDCFSNSLKMRQNHLLYDAPLALYFMASPYSDPADPVIPATYAMLAAESLGLGTCMIGSVHPFIQHGAKKLKEKWNLLSKSPSGIIVIFGYPKYKFQKSLKRTFAQVFVHQ